MASPSRAPTSALEGCCSDHPSNFCWLLLLSKGLNRVLQSWHSTATFDKFEEKNEIEDDDFINDRKELEPQGVDPKKGWGFRGVHKAIICGKVGQAPVQKILRNGRTVTIFTVGTGGLFDNE